MPVLGNADRAEVWADLMQEASEERVPLSLLKAELRADVDAADDRADTGSYPDGHRGADGGAALAHARPDAGLSGADSQR